MESIIENILSKGDVQRNCKCEDSKGKLSLAIKHDELACMVKVNNNFLQYLGIKNDEEKTDDCIIVYTSCKLRFRLIVTFAELKVSKKPIKISKAKRQLSALIRGFKDHYNSEWNRFVRNHLVIALIVHNRPSIVDGTREYLEGIELYYLQNPASNKKFRSVLRKALKSRNLPGEVI